MYKKNLWYQIANYTQQKESCITGLSHIYIPRIARPSVRVSFFVNDTDKYP